MNHADLLEVNLTFLLRDLIREDPEGHRDRVVRAQEAAEEMIADDERISHMVCVA